MTWWGVTRRGRDRSMLREVARAGVAAIGILMLALVPLAHTAQRPEAAKAPALSGVAPPVPEAIDVSSAAERRRSRTEHAGLSRSEASALLRETFPGAATSPVFDATADGLDARVVRRVDRRRAVVELDGGRRALLQSTVPLTVKRGRGRRPDARAPRRRLRAGPPARSDHDRRQRRRGRLVRRCRRHRRAGHRERQRRLARRRPRVLPERRSRHRLPGHADAGRRRDLLPAAVRRQPAAPHARLRSPRRRALHHRAHRQADPGRPAARARDRRRRQDARLRLPAADRRRRRAARAEHVRAERRRRRDLGRPP